MYISINIVRYLILISSLFALTSHIIQCTLFSNYVVSSKITITSNTKHWQCLTWYILLGFSIVCAIVLCTQPCFKRGHLLRIDKILGYINGFLILAVMLVTIFFSTPKETYTMGPMAHCYLTDQQDNPMYSVLFKRCLLLNTTWILSIFMCCLWISLLLCVHFIEYKRHDTSINKYTCCPPASTSCTDKTDEYSLKGNHNNNNSNSNNKNEDPFKNDHCFVPTENINMSKYDMPFAPHTEKLELPDSNMNGSEPCFLGRSNSLEQCYYQIPPAAVTAGTTTNNIASKTFQQRVREKEQDDEDQWFPKHYPCTATPYSS